MLKKFCIASVLTLVGFQVNAAIITNNSGNYTHDTTTDIVVGGGLEWLQWDRTIGLSWSQAYAQRDTIEGGGWSIASNQQMATLFNDFAFGITFDDDENTSQSTNTATTVGESALESDLLFTSMFGDTYAAAGRSCCGTNDPFSTSYALFGRDIDTDGRVNVARIYDDYQAGAQHVRGLAELTDDQFSTTQPTADFVGVALVRATVPEPSIIALFAAGLVGIGFARRRQS